MAVDSSKGVGWLSAQNDGAAGILARLLAALAAACWSVLTRRLERA